MSHPVRESLAQLKMACFSFQVNKFETYSWRQSPTLDFDSHRKKNIIEKWHILREMGKWKKNSKKIWFLTFQVRFNPLWSLMKVPRTGSSALIVWIGLGPMQIPGPRPVADQAVRSFLTLAPLYIVKSKNLKF